MLEKTFKNRSETVLWEKNKSMYFGAWWRTVNHQVIVSKFTTGKNEVKGVISCGMWYFCFLIQESTQNSSAGKILTQELNSKK